MNPPDSVNIRTLIVMSFIAIIQNGSGNIFYIKRFKIQNFQTLWTRSRTILNHVKTKGWILLVSRCERKYICWESGRYILRCCLVVLLNFRLFKWNSYQSKKNTFFCTLFIKNISWHCPKPSYMNLVDLSHYIIRILNKY